MPETSEKILAQLGDGKVTEKPEILFARLDVEEVMKKVEELHPQMTAEEKENQADGEEETVIDIDAKPEITFDDFGKMQFQVGEIISCEAVPKSKKLLCSQVKIGSQVKQIVSGIRKHYTPEEMVGKKVMVLVNLKPAKHCRSTFRRNASVRRRCRRKSGPDDTGKSNAGRSRDLLIYRA